MRKTGKKALSLLLALVLVLAILPTAALAADSDFVIENGVLTKYNGSGGAVTIPSGVTKIGNSAFEDCTSLTSVTIPAGVTEIGDRAFLGCTGLTGIRVDAGNQTFSSVDGVLFADGGKTLLTYPGGKRGAYVIPNGVTSIGVGAFCNCTDLTGIRVDAGNQTFSSVDGVLFADGGKTLLTYPGGKRGAYAIPNGVTSIGGGAFYGCMGLTSVTIPNSVTSIGGVRSAVA